MPFAVFTRVSPRNHVLNGGTHGRHLVDTIKDRRSVMMRAAATITITTCQ